MVDYRRMGNMVRHLVNTTSTTSMHYHHSSDLWKTPRWTVIRIQALAIVAIIITFLLAAFGSCRRWSNRWIVQKGFFAAQVLSLSLGTYSIGMMQSSSVKSEMYPVWTVSLFTLFGCVDPVTSYNGLDYKGPLSKLVYGICLYCGYVLLMSISSITSVLGNAAIGMLTAITFIKGFHRSMALVQQSIMRNLVESMRDIDVDACVLRYGYHVSREESHYNYLRSNILIDFPSKFTGIKDVEPSDMNVVNLCDVDNLVSEKEDELQSCYDACVAYSLSHRLHKRFLGLGSSVQEKMIKGINYSWALKVVGIELAFLYEVFYSGNAFLHYYQAKTASLWALASLIGICFVGVAAAIPGTMSSHHTTSGPGARTNVVSTTTADIVITFFILASLALLQLVQLIRCWTSNWARLAVVCAYVRNRKKGGISFLREGWLRVKAFVATSTNWFDKYLWQEKIGQYSMEVQLQPEARRESSEEKRIVWERCVRLVKMLGLHYFWKVVQDLLGRDSNKRGAIRLDDDVKDSIMEFLGKIESSSLDENWLFFDDDPQLEEYLPYSRVPEFEEGESQDSRYRKRLMAWYVVTWYCELAEQERENAPRSIACWGTAASCLKKAAEPVAGCFRNKEARGEESQNKHRRVANALSKYCAYLMVSVPDLLPGLVVDTRRDYDKFFRDARRYYVDDLDNDPFIGAVMGRPDRWKMLADVWVRMLVYAAPYGNAEAHMQQLAQGGEFITHLWALLYNLGICEWKPPGNLHDITTIHDARRIRAELFHEKGCRLTQEGVLIAFLDSLSDSYYSNELAAASEMEKYVSFYRTTCPKIAELFHINPAAGHIPALVLLKKEELILYDGGFNRYAIADFVSANMLPLVTTLTPRTVRSLVRHPIQKLIILFAVASESSKFLPNFKEAAKSFKGKLLFVFVELDNREAQEAAYSLLYGITVTEQETTREAQQAAEDLVLDRSTGQETTMAVQPVAKDRSNNNTLIGQETKVLISTRCDKTKFQIIGEVSLDNIKKIAQAFFEDNLYVSEPEPESNDEDLKTVVGKNIDQIVLDEAKDVLLVIYGDYWNLSNDDPYAELAKHMRGIDSLVIAQMDGVTNWHPRAKSWRKDGLKTLFYPARRKRFEPITFTGHRSVIGLYKFIKEYAAIPFEPISTLEGICSIVE